jgi:hypothetical protein
VRRVAKTLAITLSLFLLPVGIANGAITGTKCTKLGATKTASSIKYTCIKQGSKLVWNKGVAIKKPTPVPSVTKSDQTKADTQPSIVTFTPEIGNFYGTLYKDMDRLLINTPSTVKINWHISENAAKRSHQKYLKSVEYAARLWEPFFNNSEINVVLFTDADSEWIDKKQTELMGKYLINPKFQLQSNRLAQMSCNIAGFYLPNIILACAKNDTDRSSVYSASFALAHEYTHLVGMTSKILTEAQIGDSNRLTPCWVNEGFAQFIGMFGASHIDPNFRENRNSFFTSIRSTVDRSSQDSVINTFREMESVDDKSGEYCSKVQDAYFLGAIAFEKLTMEYGFIKVVEVQKQFYTGKKWADAFKLAFGLSTDEFYIQMANIITSESWKA